MQGFYKIGGAWNKVLGDIHELVNYVFGTSSSAAWLKSLSSAQLWFQFLSNDYVIFD